MTSLRGGSQSRPSAPSEVHAAAVDRVRRLEAAIEALGVGSEEAKGLEEALVRAKRGASLAPVGERLDSTAQFVERCQKRLQSAEAAVKEAIVFRDKALAELEAGQRNLEILRAEAAAQSQGTPNSANCRQRRIGSGQFSKSTHLTVGAGTGGSPSEESQVSVRSILGFERVVAKCVVAKVGSSPRQISGSRCTRSRVMENMIARGDSLARSSNRFNPLQ